MAVLTPRARTLFQVTVAFLVLAVAAVVLRFAVRVHKKRSPLVSDYLITCALCVFIAHCGIIFKALDNPAGDIEVASLTVPQIDQLLKYLFAQELTFSTGITLSKISVISFYRSIFITQSFRWASLVVLAFALAWWIGTFFLIIFQCHPVEAFWDVLAVLAGQCIPTGVLIFGFELSNVFVDLLIIALPLNEIRKLQMPLQRKLALTSVFGLGGFVVITSIVRMAEVYRANGDNTSIPITTSTIWTNIQYSCTIIAACLPCLAPLIPKSMADVVQPVSSFFRSLLAKSAARSSHASSRIPDISGTPSHESGLDGHKLRNDKVYSKAVAQAYHPGDDHADIPMNQINVRRDVDVERGT